MGCTLGLARKLAVPEAGRHVGWLTGAGATGGIPSDMIEVDARAGQHRCLQKSRQEGVRSLPGSTAPVCGTRHDGTCRRRCRRHAGICARKLALIHRKITAVQNGQPKRSA